MADNQARRDLADLQRPLTESFALNPEAFRKLVDAVGRSPTVDAFATPVNSRLPRYWTEKPDAFAED